MPLCTHSRHAGWIDYPCSKVLACHLLVFAMNPKLILPRCLFVSLLFCLPQVTLAGDELPSASSHALVFMAPVDRWAVRLELRGNGWKQKYNDDGERVAFGGEFDQLALDSNLFPALGPFGAGASLGMTAFDARVSNSYGELDIGFGVTADLTVGALIPFGRSSARVNFAVDGGNVGFNPAFDPSQPVSGSNYPFAPVGGAVAPMGTEGVQQLLTDPVFGYGYERIEDTRRSGLGDPTVGGLWRFYKSDKESLVLGLGVRFGIARKDDPDNLLDFPIGDGSTDLRGQLEYFRDLGNGFDLRLLLDRKIQLADRITVRIPAPGQLLAPASSKERVARDLGDFWEYDVEVGKSLGDWRGSLTWHRYDKQADRYTSDVGTDTSALEANTRVYANQWRAAISWSGIHAWSEKRLPLPLIVRLETQRTYQGRNFVDVRDYYVRLTSFF